MAELARHGGSREHASAWAASDEPRAQHDDGGEELSDEDALQESHIILLSYCLASNRAPAEVVASAQYDDTSSTYVGKACEQHNR